MQPRALELPSVSAITTRAGIAKGTFYLYFETREELYLSILRDGHLAATELILEELAGVKKVNQLSAALCRGYLRFAGENPQAVYLSGIAVVILEGNVSDQLALDFKRGSVQLVQTLAEGIQAISKDRWSFQEIARRLVLSLNIVVVLWQTAHPPRNIEELLRKHPELSVLCPDFEESVNHALALIWA